MLLITGATGTIGSSLLRELAAEGAAARVFVRDPAKARSVDRLGFEVALGSFEDERSVRAALAGVHRLFLLSPPATTSMVQAQRRVVDASRDAGVEHIVKLSSIGADERGIAASIIRAHRDIEQHVEDSGVAYTHLRPHWFMQNELAHGASITTTGTFAAPDVARISTIDARDIAAVAARVLVDDGHAGAAYVLTGPAALSYGDIAQTFARVLRRPVRWIEVGLDEARDSMLDAGLPAELAVGFTEILARYREGGVTAQVSPAVEQILGRPPRSFEQFVHDHRHVFAGLSAVA